MKILNELTILKEKLDKHRPFEKTVLKNLIQQLSIELNHNSTAIEGNSLSLRETRVVIETGMTIGGKSVREHLEVINHQEAFYFIEELSNKNSMINEWDIKNIHSIIVKGIESSAGSYRKGQALITGAKHIPPSAIKLSDEMKEFVAWYEHEGVSLHPVVRAALVHLKFVGIHPFADGNGRTSRLLMNLELLRSGYPITIIRKENRLEYYDALDKGHTTGEYTDFINLVGREVKKSFEIYFSVLGI